MKKPKPGNVVTVIGIDCPVLEVHRDDLVTVFLPGENPKILIGVPPFVEGGPRPSHGAFYTNVREAIDHVLTDVERAEAPQAVLDFDDAIKAGNDLVLKQLQLSLEPVFDELRTIDAKLSDLHNAASQKIIDDLGTVAIPDAVEPAEDVDDNDETP